MAKLVAAKGPEAALARKVVAGYISYALHRVGEVTDSLRGIDLIMGFGFNWAPPGVLVDTIGARATVAMLKDAGVPVPEALVRLAKDGERQRLFNERKRRDRAVLRRRVRSIMAHSEIYILGGYQTDFSRNWTKENKHFLAMMREAVLGGLAATDIDPEEIEVAHVGNFAAELY